MIEEFFLATDNNGSCWDFTHRPKWRAGFWENVKGAYREYHGTNKPAPGRCEKRYSVPILTDVATLAQQIGIKDKEVNELRTLLNNAKIRAADLEAENKAKQTDIDTLNRSLSKKDERIADLEQRIVTLKREERHKEEQVSGLSRNVFNLESANKELQVQLETFKNDPNLRDLYFHMNSSCIPGSYIEGILKRLNKKFNFEGLKIEKDGIYETECGKKVYVCLQEGVYWQCYSPHFGHQLADVDGYIKGGKYKLVKRIGDL